MRTFPGMRVTAETTRFKPMVEWWVAMKNICEYTKNIWSKHFYLVRPAEDGAYYTLILSNLDINTRRNR